MAYTGAARFRFEGPHELCSKYIRPARVLAELAINSHGVGTLVPSATMSRVLADGTYIRVAVFQGTPPIITIRPVFGGAESKHTTVDTTYYFYSTDAAAETGAYYIPFSRNDALDGLEDDDGGVDGTLGEWRIRELPEPNNWIGMREARYFSLDLRVSDGQPRWVTEWDDRVPMMPGFGSSSPYTGLGHFWLNGKQVEAANPSSTRGVVGAVVDSLTYAVFMADRGGASLTLERHDWNSDTEEWEESWSTAVPSAAAAANSMRISEDGAAALISLMELGTGSSSSTDGVTIKHPILYSVNLDTGAVTHVYGDIANHPTRRESVRIDATDTDFPDECIYTLETNVSLEAGVDTSATLLGISGETAEWKVMPRVGDRFHFGNSDPNSDASSLIEIDTVSYTPRPYSVSGQIFGGSIEPHLGQHCDVTFTWIKAGEADDGMGGTTPINHAPGTRLWYVNQDSSLAVDYVKEEIETVTGEYVVGYGFAGNQPVYMKLSIDDVQTQIDTASGTGGTDTFENDYERISETFLEYVGGPHDTLVRKISNMEFWFYQIVGVSGVTFASDPDTFSGVDAQNASGDMQAFFYQEVFEPTPGETGAVISVEQYDIDYRVDAEYQRLYGFEYDLTLSSASVPITESVYIAPGGGNRINLRLSGDPTTRTDVFPYKDTWHQVCEHNGAEVARWTFTRTEDFGDTATTTPRHTVANPNNHHASASFNAIGGLREYQVTVNTALADANFGVISSGKTASDPYHNIVVLFEQDQLTNTGPEYTLVSGSQGYLWRETEGVAEDAPLSLFTTGDLVELQDVRWGAIITDTTTEVRSHASESEAQDTYTLRYTETYRRP